MITIHKELQQLMPTYNPMIVVVTSDYQSEESFTYVTDITVRGDAVSRLKTPVNPEGYGVIDFHKHVENSVTYDFNPNATYWNPATYSGVTYSLYFSEEFRYYFDFVDSFEIPSSYVGFPGTTSSAKPLFSVGDEIVVVQSGTPTNPTYNGVAVITGITQSTEYDGNSRWTIKTNVAFGATTSTNEPGYISLSNFSLTTTTPVVGITESYAFNGVKSFVDFISWDYTDYVTSTDPGAFLTNAPNNYKLDIDSSMFLNVYQEDGLAYNLNIETNKGTYKIVNGFTASKNKFVQIGCGPYQLINATASIDIITGTFPILDSTSSTMSLYVTDGGDTQTIATKTFKIIDSCKMYDKIQIIFMDKMGSFVPYTFTLVHRKFNNINRTNYQQTYGKYAPATNSWNYNTYDRGMKTLDIVVTETYTVISDWVNQSTSDYLIEMFESSEVYFINQDGLCQAININTSAIESKLTINGMLINYQLDFELSNKNASQR